MLIVNCKSKSMPVADNDTSRRFFSEVRKYKPLSDEEQKNLLHIIKQGNKPDSDNAREKLVLHNQRLVISLAKHLTNGDDFNDLVSEGTIGLNRAIDKFNMDFKQHFITYAVFWINKVMIDYMIGDGRLVTPKNANVVYTYVSKANNDFFVNNGRYPSAEELQEILKEKNVYLPNKENLFPIQIKSICEFNFDSFEKDNAKFDIDSVKSYLEKTSSNNVDDKISNDFIRAKVEQLLSILTDTQKYIIKRYYGIGCDEETFFIIGTELGMDERKVIKQYKKALKILQKNTKFNYTKTL